MQLVNRAGLGLRVHHLNVSAVVHDLEFGDRTRAGVGHTATGQLDRVADRQARKVAEGGEVPESDHVCVIRGHFLSEPGARDRHFTAFREHFLVNLDLLADDRGSVGDFESLHGTFPSGNSLLPNIRQSTKLYSNT